MGVRPSSSYGCAERESIGEPRIALSVGMQRGGYHSLRYSGSPLLKGKHMQSGTPSRFLIVHAAAVVTAASFSTRLCAQPAGTIVGWGWDDYEQVSDAPLDEAFIAVATGWYHSVGLRADGSLAAWGNTALFQQRSLLDVPQGNNFVAIAAGYTHSMALRNDGTIACWGWDFSGETYPPDNFDNVIAIACGEKWSLVLDDEGLLHAWGESATCGDSPGPGPCAKCHNQSSQHYIPTAVPDPDYGHFFIAISASGHFGLALQEDGALKAWGADDHCQVTEAYTGYTTKFTAGHKHGIALDQNGAIATGSMWGHNDWGQRSTSAVGNQCAQGQTPYQVCPTTCCVTGLGCYSLCYKPPPSPFPTDILDVAGGYYHSTLRLSNGSLVAWGKNAAGQCYTPTGTFFVFSSSYDHGLALEGSESDTYVNCDESTNPPILDANDILCFIDHYIHNSHYADCNGDSTLSVDDWYCWYGRFSRVNAH